LLAISFDPKRVSSEPQILLLELDHPNERKWINSDLKRINEIAFSDDGQTFAAGGCCWGEAGSGLDQIQVWSVSKSGLTPKRWTPKRPTLPLSQFAQGVQDLAFASATLLVGGRFGAIDLWTPNAEEPVELRVDTRGGISFVTFNRGEWLGAAASSQAVVRLWDTSHWPPFELTPSGDDPAKPGFLVFTGNGARLISAADEVDYWDLDPASLQRKVCALLREVDPNGVHGDTPWHKDRECKVGALTPPPRSFLERIQDFFTRAWAALRFLGGTN
jgi:WD40 repeat protein